MRALLSPESTPRRVSDPVGRIHALDAARGGAMVLVVVGHALLSFMRTPVGWAIQDRSQHLIFDAMVWIAHAFLMPVFFLIAGFLARATIAGAGIRAFIRQRALRILVPLAVLALPNSFVMNHLWDLGLVRSGGHRISVAATLPALRTGSSFSLGHLWFLYYLLLLSVAVLLLWALASRLSMDAQRRIEARMRSLGVSPFLPIPMIGCVAAILWWCGKLQVDTPLWFVPDPAILAYYAVFFAWGILLHAGNPALDSGARWGRGHLIGAALLLGLLAPFALRGDDPRRSAGLSLLLFPAGAALTCLLVAGFMAACARHANRPRPSLRALSRASFWTYVMHLPLVVFLQIQCADLDGPAPLKLSLILAITLGACLASHRYLVRRTILRLFFG